MVCLQDHPEGTRPRVSVVTSVHNNAPFIRDAVQSILAQSFTDFEYLILDDGSTDQTPAILAELAAADSRITVITQQQLGVPRSLNKGTALARGRYLARQDADDLSMPQRLERQVAFLDQHPDHAVVGSFVRRIDSNSAHLTDTQFPVEDMHIRSRVLAEICFVHGALLMRRDAVQAVGGYRVELPITHDYDLYLRLLERFRVANLADLLYSYRAHGDSFSQRSPDLTYHYVEIVKLLAQQRQETGKDLLMLGSNPAAKRIFTPATLRR